MSKRKRSLKAKRKQPQEKFPRIPVFAISLVLLGIIVSVFLLQNSRDNKPDFPVTVRETPLDTMYFLITTHPKPEIREDLYALLNSGKTKLLFQLQDESPEAEVLAGEFLLLDKESQEDKKPLPVFYFNPTLFVQDRTYSDLLKQSVILHEYEHYLQWKTARYPEYTFLAGFQLINPEVMRIIFESELEAYLKGCDMAIEYGVAYELSICEEYRQGGIAGLRRALAHSLAQKYGGYRTLLQELAIQRAMVPKTRVGSPIRFFIYQIFIASHTPPASLR